MSPDQRQEAFAADPANTDIANLYRIDHPELLFAKGDEDMSSDGRPIVVTDVNGVKRTILALRAARQTADGETHFTCVIPGKTKGATETVEVTKGEVFRTQLLATRDSIAQADLPTEQQAALKLYLDYAEKGDEGIPSLGGADMHRVLEQAAQSTGMLTVDDMRQFAENILGVKGVPISSEQQARINQALQTLDGKSIVGAEDVANVFQAFDINPESLGKTLDDVHDTVRELERQVDQNPQHHGLRRQLAQARTQEIMLQSLPKFFDKDGPLQEYFQDMITGNITPEQAKNFQRAIRNGDEQEFIEYLIEASGGKLDKKTLEKITHDKRGLLLVFGFIIFSSAKKVISPI